MNEFNNKNDGMTLTVTPKPVHGESLMGFLLRTAIENGYQSINLLFSLAGMTENEARSARPSLKKLAPLYNRNVEDFGALGSQAESSGRYLALMNHSLPSMYLRSKHARICPDCVSEQGHVHAFWELRHAVACPVHQRMALTHCPECDKEINWWRKGLTTCSCGYDFSWDKGDKISNPAILSLLEVMHAKLMGNDLDDDALAYVGFPVDHLRKMTLVTLLGVIYRLENFSAPAADDSTKSKELHGLETAAEVLSMWPTGFHRYLERVHGPNANMYAKGLRGQFQSFYESFFKKGLDRDELEFMHKAFVDFGIQQWKKASIHPRLTSYGKSSIVGIEGLAKAIGKHPRTIRKLVASRVIPVHAYNQKNGLKLFDLCQQLPLNFVAEKPHGKTSIINPALAKAI